MERGEEEMQVGNFKDKIEKGWGCRGLRARQREEASDRRRSVGPERD